MRRPISQKMPQGFLSANGMIPVQLGSLDVIEICVGESNFDPDREVMGRTYDLDVDCTSSCWSEEAG